MSFEALRKISSSPAPSSKRISFAPGPPPVVAVCIEVRVALSGSAYGTDSSTLYRCPLTKGRSRSPSSWSTTTSKSLRGCIIAPPSIACPTRIQVELRSSVGRDRSHGKRTFTLPKSSVWISSPEGVVTQATTGPLVSFAATAPSGLHAASRVFASHRHAWLVSVTPSRRVTAPSCSVRVTTSAPLSEDLGWPSTEKRRPGSSR